MDCYQTKLNRKKLTNAYNTNFDLFKIFYIEKDQIFDIYSSSGKKITLNTIALTSKATRNTQGVMVMKQKGFFEINKVEISKNNNKNARVKK